MDTTTAHLDEGCSVGAAEHQHFLTSGVQSWHGPLGQRRRMVAVGQRGHEAEMGGAASGQPQDAVAVAGRAVGAGGVGQEAAEKQQHHEQRSALPETPWSPGNSSAVSQIPRCAPKPGWSQKGLAGSWGWVPTPTGQGSKAWSLCTPSKGLAAPPGTKGTGIEEGAARRGVPSGGRAAAP